MKKASVSHNLVYSITLHGFTSYIRIYLKISQDQKRQFGKQYTDGRIKFNTQEISVA